VVRKDVEHRLAAILKADVAGYSRLMAQDEDETVRTRSDYREEIELLVRQHQGRLVDFRADDFLAEFSSALEAVRCAVQIQRTLEARNADLPDERRMELRVGVHMGDVRVDGDQIMGDGVNIAARLEGLAEVGGICVSGAVADQVRRKLDLELEDLGSRELKNIPDPVHVFRARWSEPARPKAGRTAVSPDMPSVAVLPFVNMSSDPDQEYFADGMSEELINALTQVKGLRVIARTSAFSFKGTNADIATIGRKLDVGAVVEGSVRKAGNRLRITAQLIDVAGGDHLWSDVYDRSLDDVFEIQDEIARTIVRTIGPKLLGESAAPLVTRRTESQEAYELYLRAVDRVSRMDRWDTRTAIEMLKDATAIDPDYADAWGQLALAYSQMEVTFDPDVRWHELAEQAVERAFELDRDNIDALHAHGRIVWSPRASFQHRTALRSYGRALELQPGSHGSRVWHSAVFLHVGLLDEAREGITAALRTQPDDALCLNIMAQVACYGGHLDEALEYADRAMRANPTFLFNHMFHPVYRLYLGDLAAGERGIEKSRQVLRDDPLIDASEALLWAKRGEETKALEALSRAMQDKPSLGHIHHAWHHAAQAYALLGKPVEAISRLRAASVDGLPQYPLFRDDPHLASLQAKPEMNQLLSDLKSEWNGYRSEFGRS
jgi:adenylate cyclase